MRVVLFLTSVAWPLAAQEIPVGLVVPHGAPLRLYLTQRLAMHLGAAANAKLIEPVYAFDRIVVPAGSEARGHVTVLEPVGKLARTQSILGGDFTPLHRARVEFTRILLPNGQALEIHTRGSAGLSTIYNEPKPSKKTQKPGRSKSTDLHGLANREVNARINEQLDSRTYGLGSLVRGPNKKERLVDFLYAKLPYHPQRYRRGTRFDAELEQPLDFGSAVFASQALTELGTDASYDRAVEVRFLSAISSATANLGDSVQAALTEPLLGSGNKLVLPEGTRLDGTVRQARPARWLHRTGKLRFTFDRVTLPASVASLPQEPLRPSEARLVSSETDPSAGVKIDSEGTAVATTSKTRLLAPAVAALIAVKSMDNDYGKPSPAGGNGSGNAGGSALGGFSGFGLLGVAASQASVIAGSALGMWGMAASVYNHVVRRGPEVEFGKNSSMVVRFGARSKPGAATD